MANWLSGICFGVVFSVVVFYARKHTPELWIAAMKRIFLIRVVANEIWKMEGS